MKKHSGIEKCCAYCEHLTFTCPQKNEDGKKYPSPYLAYLAVLADPDCAESISCPYKKQISLGGRCLHFKYDPLKRHPSGHAERPTLDPALVLED